MKTHPDLIAAQLPYDSPDFAEAWQNWVQFRREIKKPITPTARVLQLRKLRDMGKACAIESIEQSICAGWTGLFPPKGTNGNGSKPESAWSLKQRIEAGEDLILEIQGLNSFKNLSDEKKAKIRKIRANVQAMQEQLALLPK